MAVDLVTFLRARFDEDEALARAATPGPWVGRDLENAVDPTITGDGVDEWGEPTYVAQTAYDGLSDTTTNSVADARHIIRHDPARVLAEVAAKRAIIGLHAVVEPGEWRTVAACAQCGDARTYESYMVEWPCPTLRALAQVYADHPDYDEAVTWNDYIAPRP